MGSAICKQKHHKSTYIRPRKRGGREAGDGLFWAPRSNLGENLAAATPCSARDTWGRRHAHMGIQRPDARLVISKTLDGVSHTGPECSGVWLGCPCHGERESWVQRPLIFTPSTILVRLRIGLVHNSALWAVRYI